MKLLLALLLVQIAGFRLLDTSQPVTFYIEDGKNVGGYDKGDSDLAELAFAAWSRESGGKLKFVRSDEKNALILVLWSSPDGGRFGVTERRMVGGKPGALVYVMPDTGKLGEPLASAAGRDPLLRDSIVYLTFVHEIGHAVGLSHTDAFADIMYSFEYGGDFVAYFARYRNQLKARADIGKVSGLSAADVATLKALY